MKKIFVVCLLVLTVLACHRKTIAESEIIISNKPAEKQKETPLKKETGSETTLPGQTVYTSRCGRCHALKPVEKFTAAEWENILKSMIPKAKLNETEARQVTAYVMEHAKK